MNKLEVRLVQFSKERQNRKKVVYHFIIKQILPAFYFFKKKFIIFSKGMEKSYKIIEKRLVT